MIVITCLPCELAIRVLPENVADVRSVAELDALVGEKSDFWPNKYQCPRCDQPAAGLREVSADPRALRLMTVRNLSPQEAFALFNGLGFPEEQQCSIEALQELLREQPVRRVIGRNITGATTVHVDAFELWDGTKIHFGAGAAGAVVFRIVRPPSYTKRALEGATP